MKADAALLLKNKRIAELEEDLLLTEIALELESDENRAGLASGPVQVSRKAQKSRRPDQLTAHVEAARHAALAPDDCSSAWLAFVASANSDDPKKAPLVGGDAREGVRYMTGDIGDDGHGIVGTLSRRAFGARFHPRPDKSRKVTPKHGT